MASSIMPLVKGLIEEGTGSHSAAVAHKTCNVYWYDIQKSAGSALAQGNAIDQFIAHGYTGRVRFFMHPPAWAISKFGSITVYDSNNPNNIIQGVCLPWWKSNVQAAQADVIAKLAAAYDGKISAIFIANNATIYAEPFQRGIGDLRTRQNLLKAGYTADLDKASYVAGYEMFRVFKSTRLAQAFNPWQYITSGGSGATDITFTIEMMDKLASIFPRRAIWQNNSIRGTPIPSYLPMYDHMKQGAAAGRPLSFQTETAPRLNAAQQGYQHTLQWAVDQGAHAVELSPTYQQFLSPQELSNFDRALRASPAT